MSTLKERVEYCLKTMDKRYEYYTLHDLWEKYNLLKLQTADEENKPQITQFRPTVRQMVHPEIAKLSASDDAIKSQMARDLGTFMLENGNLKFHKGLSRDNIEYTVWFDGFVKCKGEKQ